MKRFVFLPALMLLLLVGIGSAHAQDTVWVSADRTALQSERSSSSRTLAQLSAGTRLKVLDYQNRWYRVAAPDGRTGWIYRGKVTTRQPAASAAPAASGTDSVGSLLGGVSGQSGIQAGATDTSRSIRGLSPEALAYASQTQTPEVYRNALDRVLAIEAEAAQINWFLKTEKIGEYAE